MERTKKGRVRLSGRSNVTFLVCDGKAKKIIFPNMSNRKRAYNSVEDLSRRQIATHTTNRRDFHELHREETVKPALNRIPILNSEKNFSFVRSMLEDYLRSVVRHPEARCTRELQSFLALENAFADPYTVCAVCTIQRPASSPFTLACQFCVGVVSLGGHFLLCCLPTSGRLMDAVSFDTTRQESQNENNFPAFAGTFA